MYINNSTTQNYNYSQNFIGLPKKYKVVDKYLIRGPHPHVNDVFSLKKEGVNTIYDFRHKGIKGFKWLERLTCKIAGIEYKRKPFSFLDNKFPTQEDYENIANEVRLNGEKGGKSLFHCNSGTHRTSLMTAFYEITKGKPLEVCKKEDPDFGEKVKNITEEQIINRGYFTRNKVVVNTRNPIVKAKNVFNNLVVEGITKAYNLFMDMMK